MLFRLPFASYLLEESKLQSIGKTKYGLLKQLGVLLFLCSIIIPFIILVSIISFIIPWLTLVVIVLSIGMIVYFAVKTFNIKNKDMEKAKSYWLIYEKMAVVPGVIWISAFIFGLLCWFGSILFNFNIPNSSIIFPLSAPKVSLVDSSRNVYCLSRFYNRLQVFDNNGNFLRGWFIDLPAGAFRITEDNDNNIQVISNNKPFIAIFDKDGTFLRKKQKPNYDKDFYTAQVVDNKGYSYKILYPYLLPQIIKTDDTDNKTSISNQSLGHWLVTMPIPGFVFLMLLEIIKGKLSRRFELHQKYLEHLEASE